MKLYRTISYVSDKYLRNLLIIGDFNYPHIYWTNPDNESTNDESINSSDLFLIVLMITS